MFFFTVRDPDYMVKGARDPLGFQVLWQNAGRSLIPYLSTVSANITDFQIMTLAYAIKQKQPGEVPDFIKFFLHLESVMAYARYSKDDSGFNGVNKVKASQHLSEFEISDKNRLLQNQQAYGIWGKYNRPFTDLDLANEKGLIDPLVERLAQNPKAEKKLLEMLHNPKGTFKIKKADLPLFYPFLERPMGDEKETYSRHLLEGACEGELLRILKQNPELNPRNLYAFISAIENKTNNAELKALLDRISRTEQVISPLSHIFNYIQTKTVWNITDIETSPEINNWKRPVSTTGLDPTVVKLGSLMLGSNIDLVIGLIKRNEVVCSWRGSAPWIRQSSAGIEVFHFEGASSWREYDPDSHSDNSYFLDTYVSLHRQLSE